MKPLVSVCCITYNQEKYIAHTLESILMQRTDFAFEILVYDDASDDSTPAIIQHYQNMYPGLIKPIFQTVNQYSQGVEVNHVYNYTRSRGKYVAYCEGTDYWADLYKLQKQVAFMEKNPNICACIHADKIINETGEKVIRIRQDLLESRSLTMEEIIQTGGNFSQSSLLYRNELFQNVEWPTWYFYAPESGFPLLLWLGIHGEVYYLNDIMSSFRRTPSRFCTPKVRTYYAGLKKMLLDFDKHTEFEYSEIVRQQIHYHEFIVLLNDKQLKIIKSKEYLALYQQMEWIQKIKLHLSYYLPLTHKFSTWLKETDNLYLFNPKEILPYEN